MSYIGTTEIGKMFLGDIEIDKAYLGNDLVFSGAPPAPKQYTITLYPSSYDTEHYSWYSISNAARGYTDASSTNYATITCNSRGAEAYIYYKFDTSSIPDGAEIVSVACTAKAAAAGNSTTTPVKQIQMATGTTLKGTATTISSTATARELDVGEWTLAELRDISVRPYMKEAANAGSRYAISFYGATLTITYTV